MDSAPEIATTLQRWLAYYGDAPRAVAPEPTFATFRTVDLPTDLSACLPALAALAAEALARDRTLWIITADDRPLPDLSNAIDLRLRPLCLVLPGAEYASRIALRATLALLKSRLARAAEDSAGPAWVAMREHLRRHDELWRACLAWSARDLDGESPPTDIGGLFPVRISPWNVAERLATPADWVMLIQADELPHTLRAAWPGACRTLMLGTMPFVGRSTITTTDAVARLRAELEVLGQELAEMELEFATAQGELAAFSADYHARVAWRLAELDRLQADLAELRMRRAPDDATLRAKAGAARARAEHSYQESRAHAASHNPPEPTEFSPSSEIKKRFRRLAQKIHPDRATDEADRIWRTQLMSEANRAYRSGDAAALDEVLGLWLAGPQSGGSRRGTVSPGPTNGEAGRLVAEITRIRQRIAVLTAELDRLYGSKLYELFTAAKVAARQGRDLLHEMTARLDRQLAEARATTARACESL